MGARYAWALGGRVWEDKDGVLTYVIRRQVGGKRYEVSTRCIRLRPALAQLEHFEADPEGYDPGAPTGEPGHLTSALAKLFSAWSGAAEREGGKGNSRPWVLQQKAYLAWWADQLKARDLRALSLRDHVIPPLDGQPGRKHRVVVF